MPLRHLRHQWLQAGPGLAACAVILVGAAVGGVSSASGDTSSAVPVSYLDQGWSAADRQAFYTTSQGSHLLPYAWFKALRRLDRDAPFGADQLERYGYLRNEATSNTLDLPVGFAVDTRTTPNQLGLTCAACHTGQIEATHHGVTRVIRIDGAPASADFQLFLTELGAAARATLSDPARFDRFSHEVLGADFTADGADRLQAELASWVTQFDAFMSASLPTSHPWGPGRLDAFGMIFNRVVARDLARPDNFVVADAPVSYPFLWNAHRQDQTQWTGTVPNGLFIMGLGRNTGEALGVFADFTPYKLNDPTPVTPRLIRYNSNSVDFEHLQGLEEKLAVLAPPPWPASLFGLDRALAARGKPLFETHCSQCHSDAPSAKIAGAWATTVTAVGTDPKVAVGAARISRTGVYEGSLPPPPDGPFGQAAPATLMLKDSVLGLLTDHGLRPSPGAENALWRALRKDSFNERNGGDLSATSLGDLVQARAILRAKLGTMYALPQVDARGAAYEGRSLHGVWATAPFLHNGSVPNLWELLKPPAQRVTTFAVGSRRFDPVHVGFDTENTARPNGTFVSGNQDPFGNGNGGHDYATKLNDKDRWAIIEYMKTL